jgi:hypothetical protein
MIGESVHVCNFASTGEFAVLIPDKSGSAFVRKSR